MMIEISAFIIKIYVVYFHSVLLADILSNSVTIERKHTYNFCLTVVGYLNWFPHLDRRQQNSLRYISHAWQMFGILV